MIDIRVHDPSTPPALVRAVVDHARRTGASIGWVEEVLADPEKRFAFFGRDQPDGSPAWLAPSPDRGRGAEQPAARNA